MQEISVKHNPIGIKLEINQEPRMSDLSRVDLDALATTYGLVVDRRFRSYIKRKGEGKRHKNAKSDAFKIS